MKEMFTVIQDFILRNETLVLATVIESSGSTPRGAGARMLVSTGGRIWGTIGGALSEHLAIEEAQSLAKRRGGALTKKYLLHPNEAADIGARCGGEVTVFLCCIDSAQADIAAFVKKAVECGSQKERTWFIMNVIAENEESSGEYPLSFVLAGEKGLIASSGKTPADIKSLCKNRPICIEQNNIRWFSESLTTGIVYIFGGGHVAQKLVPLLCDLDFRCVLFDDRDEFTRPELFPNAFNIIKGDFSCINNFINPGKSDYVVILTRSHQWDYEVEAFALRTEAAYIGIIGSRSKHEYIRRRLLDAGFSETAIHASRVHAPVGVAIKSETPAEVAVSIAAELIRVRAELAEP
jgi:xanthine dehydrogenase accessory factor